MDVDTLPISVMRALARTLASESRRLEREAERRAQLADDARRRARLKTIPLEIERLTAGGMTREQACEQLARTHGVPLATVHAHERQDRAAARRRQLLRLYERGLSNAEIARRLGMHEKSVARAVARARRATGTLPARP